MVFHAASETTETAPAPAPVQPPEISTAVFPPKPQAQPLHGFSFTDFKWPVNHSTTNHHHHRFRNRLAESEPRPKYSPVFNDDDHHNHYRRVVRKVTESTRSTLKNDHNRVSSLGDSTRTDFESEKSTNPDRTIEKSLVSNAKSKVFIRFRTKNKSDADNDDDGAAEAPDQTSTAAEPETEEPAPKTWNLRPRKPVPNRPNGDGEAPEAGGAPAQDTKTQHLGRAESSRARNGTEMKVSEKRPRFSIPLSKDDIVEDIFVFTGSKPARRPKKRARNVQKQLDSVFPGLWLHLITPESYKITDTPRKG